MNGISLAALLGVSTWFGSKVAEDGDARCAGADDAPVPASELETCDGVIDQPEFIWPPNALFQ